MQTTAQKTGTTRAGGAAQAQSAGPNGIPVIDVAALLAAPAGSAAVGDAAAAVARDITAASRDTGFFYLSGHDVPQDLVDRVLEANRWFHAHGETAKLPLKLNAWHRGYQPMASTRMNSSARFEPAPAPNQLESFIIRDAVAEDNPAFKARAFFGPNQWPAAPDFEAGEAARFRETLETYFAATRQLALDLLPAFSLAVGEAPDFFRPFFQPAGATLRLVHYPPTPAARPGAWMGIYPHTDYGFFTILAQDEVGGLEIMAVDGTWLEAPAVPGAFITNIGDTLARWTNDAFNSSPHRVINKSTRRDRYSVATFFDPNFDAEIRCIDAFVAEGAAPRHDPIRYEDYYAERMNSNHPDRRAAD